MNETGTVTKISGGDAHITFKRTSACKHCMACGMLAGQNEVTISAENCVGAKEGDRVTVEFTSKNAYASSAIAYVFPLGMLFLGLFVGFKLPFNGEQQVMAAIMGIVFTAAAFVVIKLINPLLTKRFANAYTITGIDNSENDESENL